MINHMKATVVDRRVIAPSPGPGIAAKCAVYAADIDGKTLLRLDEQVSRSDTVDVAYLRWSEDDGRTWSEPREWAMRFDDPQGVGRRHARGGYVDPVTGRCLIVRTEGILPTDDPIEGMRHWTLHYTVSDDGGRTMLIDEQIIHEGDDYNAEHFLPDVTVGKNCAMMGDLGQRPLTRSDGVILVPIQSSRVGPDGDYYNPGGALTFTDCIILMGRWREDGGLSWTCGERILGDPARTTRGWIEPTIAQLASGDLLVVMRGSNQKRSELPAHKWFSLSSDGGMTFTDPQPWTYDDGVAFHSPSSCSQLQPLRDGRLLWLGNICEQNANANSPRYPLVLGEVDRQTGRLLRDSVSIIDDKAEDESPYVTLSNFYLREDFQTGELLLYLSRLFSQDYRVDRQVDWTCDALEYRIALQS